jgi:hypothetical protein
MFSLVATLEVMAAHDEKMIAVTGTRRATSRNFFIEGGDN